MAQYIDKAAVVAEIERRIKINKGCMLGLRNLDYYQGRVDAFNDALSFFNTLEVKDVDLEEAFDEYLEKQNAFTIDGNGEIKCYNGDSFSHVYDIYPIAKYFFELGIKVNCPITANDRGMAEEIIINLKRVEKDYQINLTKEIEWLRNKTNKGE